jgi:hypothetical protein
LELLVGKKPKGKSNNPGDAVGAPTQSVEKQRRRQQAQEGFSLPSARRKPENFNVVRGGNIRPLTRGKNGQVPNEENQLE